MTSRAHQNAKANKPTHADHIAIFLGVNLIFVSRSGWPTRADMLVLDMTTKIAAADATPTRGKRSSIALGCQLISRHLPTYVITQPVVSGAVVPSGRCCIWTIIGELVCQDGRQSPFAKLLPTFSADANFLDSRSRGGLGTGTPPTSEPPDIMKHCQHRGSPLRWPRWVTTSGVLLSP